VADRNDVAQLEYEASMREYRKNLEQCETDATSELDRTTVALSGGALGIALTFLKEVPATTPKWAVWILAAGMLALVVSLMGVLLSLMAARKSMRYELECVDGKREKPEGEQDGGWWRSATESFNWTALVCCVLRKTLRRVRFTHRCRHNCSRLHRDTADSCGVLRCVSDPV